MGELLSVKANSVLCGKWIHSICARVKKVTPEFSGNFIFRKCEWNIGEAVEQEERLCDEVKTVRQFTYLGDRVSAGGCATARSRCGWVKIRECGELLNGRFPLKLKGAIYKLCKGNNTVWK